MNDQTDRRTMNEPGTPVIPMINWTGLWTLYLKEVRRFFKVQLQTIWGPALTTLLFLVIFTVALGRAGRTVMGVPFADFIAPGDRKSTRLNSSPYCAYRMPSFA